MPLSSHAIKERKQFHGIVDILEDYIEHIHQISAKLSHALKNKSQQAHIHSKMEPIQNRNIV
jgi:hypothetical protein